jgi:hypothetical protein
VEAPERNQEDDHPSGKITGRVARCQARCPATVRAQASLEWRSLSRPAYMPHLGRNSREDAQAFLDSARFKGPIDLSPGHLASHVAEFRDAEELLVARGTSNGTTEEMRLVQKDHRLLLKVSSGGRLRCAALIAWLESTTCFT